MSYTLRCFKIAMEIAREIAMSVVLFFHFFACNMIYKDVPILVIMNFMRMKNKRICIFAMQRKGVYNLYLYSRAYEIAIQVISMSYKQCSMLL